ncbi:unnamed protein product [Lactuca saligna]|uniref:Sulfotransferase n=1 Tax=Lactuca saligna TaxID=75948 RepID=A0AA35ZWR4_LACSI|nr:unnamed protein product [Lactuca saligna]
MNILPMFIPDVSLASKPNSDHEEHEKKILTLLSDSYKEKFTKFPREKGWMGEDVYMYQGYWYISDHAFSIETVMAVQERFQAQSTDIYIVTQPKCGTTWIKALVFAIVNRTKYKNINPLNHPLKIYNPHKCVPFLETEIISIVPTYVHGNSPRLFSSHIPYRTLPKSILESGCRLVYMCRNPKDALVSWFYFANKLTDKSRTQMTIGEMLNVFVKGFLPYGPYWDHVKEYHKASSEDPTKILFLTYEDMKVDTASKVKRLAEFLGFPFTEKEVANGVVDEIVTLCSFEILKEVNKNGDYRKGMANNTFFREGKVGGWRNYLTNEMTQILDDITMEKFHGLDISF